MAELEGRLKEREKFEIKLNGAEKAAQEAIADEEKNKKQLEKVSFLNTYFLLKTEKYFLLRYTTFCFARNYSSKV